MRDPEGLESPGHPVFQNKILDQLDENWHQKVEKKYGVFLEFRVSLARRGLFKSVKHLLKL